MYGDPEALDRLAARLLALAGDVRRHADDHVRQGQRAHWVSVAADRYRDRIAQDRVRADRAAQEIEHAADVLHRHAERVRQELADLAELL